MTALVRRSPIILAAAATVLFIGSPAFASSIPGVPTMASAGPLPWESVLGVVASSITGTTAKLLALLAFAICGIGFLFSEGGSGMRKLLGIGVGISLIVGAGSLVGTFFQSGGGLAI